MSVLQLKVLKTPLYRYSTQHSTSSFIELLVLLAVIKLPITKHCALVRCTW
jgi:hypothetical protein